ncbi:MAG: hypothetical protein LBH14_00550 [Desulfobulbaceae bacterium]|jgi:tRNA (guanine37-N1)-methyltransferase|nr:hypothetical protein [Desulfobulbaceae bacterium]
MPSLRQTLKAILPEALHPAITGAYEIIGDIALLTLPDALLPYQALIGATLLTIDTRLRVVAHRLPISGEFRIGGLEIIAGEPPLATIHKENGLRFRVDVERVYFSARLAAERLRLAQLCQQGEQTLVVGSGVAPLPLTLAAHGAAATVVGVEKNADAHALAVENCRLNRGHGHKVTPVNADFHALTPADLGLFDRVVIAMPETALTALSHCLQFVSLGGFLHLYIFQDENRPLPARDMDTILAAAGCQALSIAAVRCGHCGRARYRYRLDCRLG